MKQNIPPSGPGREKDQKQAVPSAILCWGRKCVSKAALHTLQYKLWSNVDLILHFNLIISQCKNV